MLILEAIMLTAFGDGTVDRTTRRILLDASGGTISVSILAMAIYLIGNKKRADCYKKGGSDFMDQEKTFHYTYSAKEQEEIKEIRKKYFECEEEDTMTRLRRLDAGVTQKATMVSLALGIIGVLILGLGMSLVMTDLGKDLGLFGKNSMLAGIVIGIVGIIFVCAAYPMYHFIMKKERARIAPEIIRLTDALMK